MENLGNNRERWPLRIGRAVLDCLRHNGRDMLVAFAGAEAFALTAPNNEPDPRALIERDIGVLATDPSYLNGQLANTIKQWQKDF